MRRPNRSISRRSFLFSVGSGLTLPSIVRSGAIATAVSPSANDRIGVGFIGLGGMGNVNFGRYVKNVHCPAIAVCDVDTAKREKAAARVGPNCGRHNDYREVLDRKDVDAVVICVPDHWHALMAIHACEAGKDVYCEKPLSLTIRQARLMVQAARRYNRVFQTGSQQRSSGEFRKACELVRNGRIGKIETVLVNVWGTSSPCRLPGQEVPAGLDWEKWIGPAPWRAYNSQIHPKRWRAFREFSGGMLTDWGAHHLDIAQWGLGMDHSGPVEVGPPAEGERHVTLRYGNGVTVRCGEVGVNGVQFVGSKGKITVNRGFFEADPKELAEAPLGSSDLRLYESPGHHQDWQNCMRSRARPIADVEIGARTATVCHLANISLWLGRKLTWDPQKESLVGDEQASRWLDRPMRSPYHI